MILMKVNAGSEPGNPKVTTFEEFRTLFVKQVKDKEVVLEAEPLWWAKNGRLGSHWQKDTSMFILVKDEQDDPFQYYTPDESVKVFTTSAKSSSCCGSGGCSSDSGKSSSCGSGGCGSCP